MRLCQERNILLIAAAGNDGCECLHVPAALPHVLAVGAMDARGHPLDFSNWGDRYQHQGLLAPGENILGAKPGGGTERLNGTSFAAPIVSGVAALLLSEQVRRGDPPDPQRVRQLLLQSALPCDDDVPAASRRCLAGTLNPGGAMTLLTDLTMSDAIPAALTPSAVEASGCGCGGGLAMPEPSSGAVAPSLPTATLMTTPSPVSSSIPMTSGVTPSQAPSELASSQLVYALGTLGDDFGSEARRDTFKQLMPPFDLGGGTLVPANPYDARQMADYLASDISEARSLIWTLNIELTPVYAIEPKGPFAREAYLALQELLAGQIQPGSSKDYIERVSIPGLQSGRTVKLFSGQVVPVIEPQSTRGLYGWKINNLLSRRPYPCGGAMYELEIYPLVRHCAGVNPGLYHYDPFQHQLVQLDAAEADIEALLRDAHQSSGEQGVPQVLLILTARFGRLFRKYRSLAYALLLKHVGVLVENFYLVATAMNLAPCALGAGDSDRFAQASGLDYVVESSVGEFMLGSRSSSPDVVTTKPASREGSTSPPSPLSEPALHPHDLDDRLPGLADLRNHTLGDSRITIVILDGNPDHSLSCFDGADISKVFPYWHPPAEPVPREAYLQYQAIDNDDSLDKDQKAEALKAALSAILLRRIQGDNHACHITSTIVGQEHTPSPGLAPRCRVINVPLNTTVDDDEFISPLNLARAFELALDLGANIIHCAACRPTQSGEGEEILRQALRKCLEQNILIVAPAGNNEGECWCMPASLPGVLSIGALKPDGKPYKFSNWGGNNALEGIMAPGGEILGAQPANEEPVRLKGTSMAAPVVTGLCALLLSLQLQQGKPVDAEAVRAALLATALPCGPDDTDEPERCLRGKVNLPGAMAVLFGPGQTVSFAGDQVSRREHHALDLASVSELVPVLEHSPSAAVVSREAHGAGGGNDLTVVASAAITPSTAHSGLVYALGTIAYDFGDEARRDLFQQAMAPVQRDGLTIPSDPHDPRQMVEHLDRHPDQALNLIWIFQLDGTALYALDPKGPFAPAAYEMFLLMLNGQLAPEGTAAFVDHISLPGKRTERTVQLLSGEVVPVLNVPNPRGMYGWNVPSLVEAGVATVAAKELDPSLLREALTSFLQRVYHDLRNVGQTSRDRALNFAVTYTYQAAATFAEALVGQRQLAEIEVEKSPYCRLNSDCWDVLLSFYDPEDGKRSRQVFRFTVDVADALPVTVGQIKRWAVPGKGSTGG